MKIVALAGGVGGAKLAHGLTKILSPQELTIIVNTGDDFEHLGLYISPDLDTVCYTIAEKSNAKTGWGRKGETYHVLDYIKEFGGPCWFTLGDKDLALHLVRTHRLKLGKSLTEISLELEKSMGIKHKVLPMCDEKVSTIVDTVEFGKISFQDYFVKRNFAPTVKGFLFKGINQAKPSDVVIKAIDCADAIIICPSNPFVSIRPIISLGNIREKLRGKYVVAISPIIGGKAIKGPLGKMLLEQGYPVNPFSILKIYEDFLDCLYIDKSDLEEEISNNASGIIIKTENILLPDINTRKKLATKIINHIRIKTK